ncbi:MAG: MBL fold metallo-hydrolase [Microvirga sp.]|jgi:ribonuclease BN (tRNA processing enzyme)
MQLQVLGCGDAFGSGGRFHTCFHVSAGSASILIDCGASSLIAMRRFGVDPNTIQTVLISHLHGDHFGGLPFLLLDAQFVSRRTTPLTIAGPPSLSMRLQALRQTMFPGSTESDLGFPLERYCWRIRLRAAVAAAKLPEWTAGALCPSAADQPSGCE